MPLLATARPGGRYVCQGCPNGSCERDISRTLWGIFFKLCIYVDRDPKWTDYILEGQRSNLVRTTSKECNEGFKSNLNCRVIWLDSPRRRPRLGRYRRIGVLIPGPCSVRVGQDAEPWITPGGSYISVCVSMNCYSLLSAPDEQVAPCMAPSVTTVWACVCPGSCCRALWVVANAREMLMYNQISIVEVKGHWNFKHVAPHFSFLGDSPSLRWKL